ncbi:MAG: glycosyltransferase family 2 protein [Pyrinomonadaceae bacterium]
MNNVKLDWKEFISVVIPLYCEAGNVSSVLREVHDALVAADVSYEFVLIDDGSPDDTWLVISEEAKNYPALRAVRLSRNFGKESALCAGLEMARGDAVIVMDGDGQHPPSLLPEMMRLWRETGADIVEATKIKRGEETFFSKFSAGVFYLLWNKLSGFELTGASDFKLMNRKVVNAWMQMEEHNVFFRGMTAWLGFTRVQIPFEVGTRAGGQTGWSVFHLFRLALIGISAFSSIPLQLVTLAGIFFLAFSAVFSIYTLALWVAGRSVSGFATVILLLLYIGSLLMISLGIIGQYLARIYDEVKRRPRYVIGRLIEPSVDHQAD